MKPKKQLAALITAAQEVVQGAKDADRPLTAEEVTDLEAKTAEIEDLKSQIELQEKGDSLVERLGQFAPASGGDQGGQEAPAKSLGEHFVKSVGLEGLQRVKTVSGGTVAAPEYKAYSDVHSTPAAYAPWLTELDSGIVRAFRRPVISDLFGAGTLSGTAVTYMVEQGVEQGSFGAFVGEGSAKNQFHISDPVPATAALRKIAGFLTFTDEMAEDLPFWVSEINNRGLYLLALAEEDKLLNANETNFKGLLEAGIGSVPASGGADEDADVLFQAITKVQNDSGLTPDGVVINPSDYQALRLAKDANKQYYGGGPFQGMYGQGGIEWQPPIWGLRTVVSPAVPIGTAVVGAFNVGATVYRKGGVRVESTNSHDVDFTSNKITTRIEERLAFACRYPSAFVETTLSGGLETMSS